MMTGPVGSPVAAVMQENFGCSVANRFYQLLDDESDPFDVLREAERRRQQKKKSTRRLLGFIYGQGAINLVVENDQPLGNVLVPPQFGIKLLIVYVFLEECASFGNCNCVAVELSVIPACVCVGLKRAPRQGEQGLSNRSTEGKQDKTEWRPSFREYRPYGAQRQVEFSVERPVERLDYERPIRGRGGGRGGMRGRGRGGGLNGNFGGFDQRRKREQSGNDKTGVKADDIKGGGGARNCRTLKDNASGMEQTAYMEEAVETPEQPGTSEGEPLSKPAEGQPMEEVVQEMTLDEWKNLQQRNRPKPEFNIRKPESTVPSKAVVIHKSKYSDYMQKEDFEDDSHVFRKPVNDITSQLDINFGSLPRPGRGSRGGRGGRGRGRRSEETEPRPEVVVQLVAPNPDDPEDFPALA
ncbi:PREDICTED: intracellular hyaluronan-binding protein 4 [Ficedula albicollis]|uniref:intracellular hyaluronan-binding protein 4 n=1 Tax=Ficedula albicollis TaxID=59894 RepID=UPI0007AD84B1|nr:PREDICTED: intracellular hyaluronan-binding protein 4 [Ficedula albicollis]